MKLTYLILLALVLAGCGSSEPLGTPTAIRETGIVPQEPAAAESPADVHLSIVDFAGIQEHIARNQGRVVVMDAWSTSCPPCLQEFHNLVELHKQYGPERLACISLSFDYEGLGKPEEQQDRVLKFLRQQGATFDNLMSNEESDVLYRKFKLAAVPAVFVYDRAGQLRKRFDNEQAKSKAEAFTYEQVKQLVAELLEEPPSEASR
jgi:thiol-disulfide isomerase/thioredoxin